MRTGIPPQYMKQINGKIEIYIRDMGTPTYSPPHQAVKLILSSGGSCGPSKGSPGPRAVFVCVCVIFNLIFIFHLSG